MYSLRRSLPSLDHRNPNLYAGIRAFSDPSSTLRKSVAPLLDSLSRKQGCEQVIDQSYLFKWARPVMVQSYTSYVQGKLGNHCASSGMVNCRLGNIMFESQVLLRNFCAESLSGSSRQATESDAFSLSQIECAPELSVAHLPSEENSKTRDATVIQKLLKSHENSSELESALNQCLISLHEDLVVQVLKRHRSDWKLALSFFKWASSQSSYSHGSRAYNEMLDILGRMKQIKLMRQMFDEMPKERGVCINEMTFSILLNRYAGAHKVQEAIDLFYKRTDYGFELDLIAFQTLLMSLCRYKHVEEAEALFLQKQDEFPPVIKSRNIILNGWCVLGSLYNAKRFWNDIISSNCKPDLFTYSIFINSLTKSGNLGTAIKLFTSMWEKGCSPDLPICNCLIDALCFKKKIPEALKIFEEMNEHGCVPDVATYNSLIKHLCKIKRIEKVYELLDEMEHKGCLPNARTYSYMLKTMKKPEEVSDMLKRMESTSCKIDSDTYNLILKLYVTWNYRKGIRSVWTKMEESGFGPDQRSYTIMVHGLHSQGKLDEALEYYHKMRSKDMIPEPRTDLLVKAIHLKGKEGSSKINHSSNTIQNSQTVNNKRESKPKMYNRN